MIKNSIILLLFFALLSSCAINDKENKSNDLPINLKKNLQGDWVNKVNGFPYTFSIMDSLATFIFPNGDFGYYKIDNNLIQVINKSSKTVYRDKWATFRILKLKDTLLTLSFKNEFKLVLSKKHDNLSEEERQTDILFLHKLLPRKENHQRTLEKVIIRTTPCYGTCWVYNLEINANRKCYYQGLKYVDSIGNFEGTIDENYLKLLQEKAEFIDYSSLKEHSSSGMTDQQTQSVVFYFRNKKTHKLSRYYVSAYGYDETPVEFDVFLNYLYFVYSYIKLKRSNNFHKYDCQPKDKEGFEELVNVFMK